MKTNQVTAFALCVVYLGSIQCALAAGSSPVSAAPAEGSQYISHIFGSQQELNAMYERSAPSSKTPDAITTQLSHDSGRLDSDRVTLDAAGTFQDMLRNPIAEPGFDQDVMAILNGHKKMIQAVCSCRYAEHDGGKVIDLGNIVSFGGSRKVARENGLRNCFQDAYMVETGSLDIKHHSVDALWGKLGHVQSVSVPSCQYSNFKFDLNFLASYKQQHERELNEATQHLSEGRSWQGQACLGEKFPNWARTAIATLVGGFAWRARGGAIPTGSTLLARVLFGFAPFLVTSCLSAHTMRQAFDGVVMGALLTAPLFYATYSHLQGAGNIKVCDPKHFNHGTFGPAADVCSGSTKLDNLGESLGMSGFGYGMEVFFAMAYAKARGYDPTPLAITGLSYGPCYGIANAANIKYKWLNTESCVGAALHSGLALTLEEGQIRDVSNTSAMDLIRQAPQMVHDFVIKARDTGLVSSATLQSIQYSTQDVRDHDGMNGIPGAFPDRP